MISSTYYQQKMHSLPHLQRRGAAPKREQRFFSTTILQQTTTMVAKLAHNAKGHQAVEIWDWISNATEK
jgi:hypothetical protein